MIESSMELELEVAEQVFIDSSFFIARFNKRDKFHKEAIEFISKVREGRFQFAFATSDYVFDETITTILYQTKRHDVAEKCGETILKSRTLTMAYIDETLLRDAWQLFKERADKLWSFTDCTSFTFMEKIGARTALAFDENFEEAGFIVKP